LGYTLILNGELSSKPTDRNYKKYFTGNSERISRCHFGRIVLPLFYLWPEMKIASLLKGLISLISGAGFNLTAFE
jgi:hypothetical protein